MTYSWLFGIKTYYYCVYNQGYTFGTVLYSMMKYGSSKDWTNDIWALRVRGCKYCWPSREIISIVVKNRLDKADIENLDEQLYEKMISSMDDRDIHHYNILIQCNNNRDLLKSLVD